MVSKPESNRSGGGQHPPQGGSRRSSTKSSNGTGLRNAAPIKPNGNGHTKTISVAPLSIQPPGVRVNLTGLRSNCPSHEICRRCTKASDMAVRQACVYEMSRRLASVLEEEHQPMSIFVHTGSGGRDPVGGRINIGDESLAKIEASRERVGKMPCISLGGTRQFAPLCVCSCRALLPSRVDERQQHEIVASAVLGRRIGMDNILIFSLFGE